jgi:CheY-like chemotaxis protein
MNGAPTALIADDEPLLREVLRRQLAAAWPELQIVAEPRNGLEALEQCEALRPTIAFLDVHMPGMSGIEVAQRIDPRTHRVFVTAFDHYALKAFEAGVLDYLVKPVQPARLAETVARLRERLRREQPALHTESLLQQLAAQLQRPAASTAPALAEGLGRPGRATHSGRRHRLPEVRREIHAGGLAGRRRQARRGADPHAAQGTAGATRSAAVPAGAPRGGGQSARHPRRDTWAQRDGRDPAQAAQRAACR